MTVDAAADLDAAACLRVARGATVALGDSLLDELDHRRDRMLQTLASGAPVYGVSTGLGALSEHRLDAQAQESHQQSLLLARAVGGAPWLAPEEVRAVLVVRLRGLLNGDAGVSAALCRHLVAVLDAGLLPALPRLASGAAGEIIPLAHLGGALTGIGQVLDDDGHAVAAGPVLRRTGIAPYRLGVKEGIALIEGVPMTTGLALLCADDARQALRDAQLVLAAELALTGASRDALDPALARGDDVLVAVTQTLRSLAGTEPHPRSLQPPVSFRVSPQLLAHLHRALDQVDQAVGRSLGGVTDSPAYLDDERFVGSAGFSGYDLAAFLHLVTVALVGVAEVGAARLHRLMDPRVTGVGAQLSADPGPQTGLSPVHKRAVGVVHGLRRLTLPSTVGTVETSAGQEDVQSFSLEAADSCRLAVAGLRDVLACELLAVHQLRGLGAVLPDDAAPELVLRQREVAALVPAGTDDRAWGTDLQVLRDLLGR